MDQKTTDNNVLTKKVAGENVIERRAIRWMMVAYDALIYLLCWVGVFVIQPSLQQQLPNSTIFCYLGVGTVFFFGLRFLLKCYNQVFRYGSIYAFTKEILANVVAAVLFVTTGVLLTRVWPVAVVPFTSLVAFAAVYVLISLIARLLYCNLYRFAQKDTVLSRVLRRMLELFAHVDFDSDRPGAVLHLVLEPERNGASPINELQNIAEKFAIRGDITAITQINKGYINRTYKVETLSDTGHVHKYTLQRINTNVFPDVDALMDNFKLTTNHLFGRLLLPGRGKQGSVQQIRPTKDGRSYLRDDSGCWRMLTHFDNVYSLDIPERPETFYQAGRAFGMFLKEMKDVEATDVKEVIPNFHNTKSRYQDLEEAIGRDAKGRVKQVGPEIDFVRQRADKYGIISDALESGEIPTRICHNDCNLNNILFDNVTHLPVAIIDLDTVMPSSPLYDYGDSMRIGTNTAKDDEKDLSKVSCNLSLYEQYARGYLESCGDILTPEELALLPYASLIITAEDGIRFLMDHINGDTYYNIYYPGQNLDRARTQLKLVEDMEKKLPQIKAILRNIYMDLNLNGQID
ncbi:MAG: phosphotransferase [Oscillospiraceae bacterium]|nr:phosphotransferase [Oscillospiraceae bacterium]